MKKADREIGLLLLGLAVMAALAVPRLFPGLSRTDLAGDEAIYAGLVDRMVSSGDWLTPAGDDGPFLEKPPLKIWLVAAAWRLSLVPHHEGGYRALDPVFGLGALVYVVLIGRRLAGVGAGVAAAVVLLAHHALLFEQGLRAHAMEALLTLAYCGGVYHFLRWADGDSGTVAGTVTRTGTAALRARWDLYAFAVWCAVGFMTKFVSIAFLPASAALVALVTPRWRRMAMAERADWTRAAWLAFALVAPWFLAETIVHGARFWADMTVHLAERVRGEIDPQHVRPWWFYLDSLRDQWRGLAVWIVAGVVVASARAARERGGAALLILLWAALPTLALSLAQAKLRHYLHPFLPAYALCAGLAFGAVLQACHAMGQRVARAWTDRWHRHAAPVLVGLAVGGALVASLVYAFGPMEMGVGAASVRTSRVERPLAVAAFALFALRRRYGAALSVVVVMALWSEARGRLRDTERFVAREHRPLGRLAECLSESTPGLRGPTFVRLAPGQALPHELRFYFAPFRVARPTDEAQRVTRRLKDDGERAPVLVGAAAYPEFASRIRQWQPETQAALAVVPLPELGFYLLLPPPYNECATRVRG